MNRITVDIDPLVVARCTNFWFRHDREIVEFLTQAYGTMSVRGAVTAGRKRFGKNAPKQTAVHRYWKWIDARLGVPERKPTARAA